jgi:aromatase
MPVIRRSIIVEAPIDVTFDTSNRLTDWPHMMHDYAHVEILRDEGRKIWFKITQVNGSSWVSWRVVSPEGRFALAERHEPRHPFEFMQIIWTYLDQSPHRTEMTWEMNFELPQAAQEKLAQAIEHISAHTESNQAKMKTYIEERFRTV